MRRQPPFATLPPLLLIGTLLGTLGRGQVPSLLQLDHGDYQATCIEGAGEDCTYGFTLIARLVNRTTDTLFISRCRPGDPGPVYGVEVVGDTSEEPPMIRSGHVSDTAIR